MNLSVTEHFEIFERLRGCENSQKIKSRADKIVSEMRLEGYEDTIVSNLSGGERRRVSLGIALTDKKIVLLDEPTTGLDPKVRRMIWEIIEVFRTGRLLIITTHSMEEAELLSQQLTIMAHGRPRCFGTPEHLKQKFGGQIFLNISSQTNHLEFAINSLKSLLPAHTSISLVHQSSDGKNAKLLFSGSKVELLSLMLPLLRSKKEFKIESFGVNQSSLDDVFMNIVKEADADV
jgi:ABC-type multidrug transport system ATPase subunit